MQTQTPIERLQALLPDVFEPKAKTGQLYLRFRLGESLQAALSLERVVETLRIPSQSITPIPNMPACALGLMGHQGKILWAVDLSQLLKIPQVGLRPRQYDIIIVETLTIGSEGTESQFLGLSVQQIQSTLRLSESDLKMPVAEGMPSLLPYLQGQYQQGGETTFLFDVEAISNAEELYIDVGSRR